MEKKSYITVLSTEDYLKGVLCLIESLKRTNAQYPISVLVTDNISFMTEELLRKNNVNVIRKNSVLIPETIKQKNQQGNFAHWTNTFDKLQIFELVEFEKLVYLDSDMYIRKNIDELFEKEHMSATIDRPTGPVFMEDEVKLTSGLLVIEPKARMLDIFMKILLTMENEQESIGDQDILQKYDKDWMRKKRLHLNIKYNMFFPHMDYYTYYENYKLDELCVIHFILNKKPFQYSKQQFSEYIEWIESGKQKIYEKYKQKFPYNYIDCGNNNEKKILQEYFEILEKVENDYILG